MLWKKCAKCFFKGEHTELLMGSNDVAFNTFIIGNLSAVLQEAIFPKLADVAGKIKLQRCPHNAPGL